MRIRDFIFIAVVLVLGLVALAAHRPEPTPTPRPRNFLAKLVKLAGLWWLLADASPAPSYEQLPNGVANHRPARTIDTDGVAQLQHNHGW